MGRHKIPRNLEAETSLIGSILLRPKAMIEVMDIVDENSFYNGQYGFIFKVMKELFQEGLPIDSISISEKASQMNGSELKVSQLMEMSMGVSNSTIASYYARIVQDKYQRRKSMETADILIGSSQDDATDVAETISLAISSLASGLMVEKEDSTVDSGLFEMQKTAQLHSSSGKKYLGSETGMTDLDKKIEGIQDGHLGVITGYTSSGKTAIALNAFASYVILGKKVVMFSLEMSSAQLMSRICAIISGIPIHKIQKGVVPLADMPNFSRAMNLIKSSASKIYTDSNWSSIQMAMLKESASKDTSLFILDYIQLVTVDGMDDYKGLKHVSKCLQKQLQRFGVPMICLSQISNEMAKDDRPDIISTKGAGDIAASADWVIRLKNKEKQEVVDEFKDNYIPLPINVYIQKNRHGSTGRCNLYFDTHTNKFFGTDNYDFDRYKDKIFQIKGEGDDDINEWNRIQGKK